MFCHSWCFVRPYETKIVKEFQTAPFEHIRKFWSNAPSWPQKLRNKYCRLYALSFATMIFYGLNAKPQPNREKYGWTCQQCGKRTHKSKQLTHEMMFKLLSKGIVAKKTYQKVCEERHTNFDESKFSARYVNVHSQSFSSARFRSSQKQKARWVLLFRIFVLSLCFQNSPTPSLLSVTLFTHFAVSRARTRLTLNVHSRSFSFHIFVQVKNRRLIGYWYFALLCFDCAFKIRQHQVGFLCLCLLILLFFVHEHDCHSFLQKENLEWKE